MSEYDELARLATEAAKKDAERVMAACGSAERVMALSAWMDELVRENLALQAALAESVEERRATRLCHHASQISVYLRIRDAAARALDLASGKPPGGGAPDFADGCVL